MASEQRLYSFSPETKTKLRKFRLGTSRAKTPLATIYMIDKATLEIKQADDETYSTLAEVAEALPDNTPRFVILSYPLTMPSGRFSVPYVLLAYMPSTCNNELRMLYAGAKELLRREAETGRLIEVGDAEEVGDVEEMERRLKGED